MRTRQPFSTYMSTFQLHIQHSRWAREETGELWSHKRGARRVYNCLMIYSLKSYIYENGRGVFVCNLIKMLNVLTLIPRFALSLTAAAARQINNIQNIIGKVGGKGFNTSQTASLTLSCLPLCKFSCCCQWKQKVKFSYLSDRLGGARLSEGGGRWSWKISHNWDDKYNMEIGWELQRNDDALWWVEIWNHQGVDSLFSPHWK